jgi:uncharacterized protein YndB with AHSA1/START domain
MRWMLWSGLAFVVGGALVALIGWLLPVAHEASRSAQFNAPPERVYDVVADVVSYANWFDDVRRVELLESTNGKLRFREHTSSGPIVMEVESARAPVQFVTHIADPDQPFGGNWTFDIVPDGGGTRLTITERGEIYNPFFRFMARFVFGYTGTMEAYLTSLQKRLSSV